MCSDWTTSISQHPRDTSRSPQRNITTQEYASRAAHESHKEQSQNLEYCMCRMCLATSNRAMLYLTYISVHKVTSARAWEFARESRGVASCFPCSAEWCGGGSWDRRLPHRFPAALPNTVARSPLPTPSLFKIDILIQYDSEALSCYNTHTHTHTHTLSLSLLKRQYAQIVRSARTFSLKCRWIASLYKATCTHAVRSCLRAHCLCAAVRSELAEAIIACSGSKR